MNVLRVAAIVAATAFGMTGAGAHQNGTRSVKDGVYAPDQADKGRTLYTGQCQSCHGTMKSATPDMAPLLNDYVFQNTWKDRSLGELFERIRDTMPQNAPGSLSPEQLAQIIAYVLSANEFPAGSAPLSDDVEALKQIRWEPK
jgi:mono/diheme cytochrome c family protein